MFRSPPLPEQKAIARVLGTLDDKIENNQRMNATLEAMARAVFKSWFVDFDPVRAKAEGRAPAGMDAATAALFPDSFEDSALGKVPKGWRVGKVGDIVALAKQSLNPLKHPDQVLDLYSIPAFDEGQMPKQEAGADIKSNKSIVPAGCVLISKLNPHLPRVWLPEVADVRPSVCSTEFLVVVPDGAPREYVYGLLTADEFTLDFATMVTGTSGSHQRVKPDSLLDMRIIVPCPDACDAFGAKTAPLHAQAAWNRRQNATLAGARDALLPKLLSGDVRVHLVRQILQ